MIMINRRMIVGCMAAIMSFGLWVSSAKAENDIAICFVYDASGSMKNAVANDSGQNEPKYLIANRALIGVGKRLDAYLSANPSRSIKMGVVLLIDGEVTISANMANYKGGIAERLTKWTGRMRNPNDATPLGDAIALADQLLATQKAQSKHILVLTDGESNRGTSPKEVVSSIKKSLTGIHFVAFDVNANVFDSLKKEGATVVGAKNEAQLVAQFDYILQEKILLERED